MRLRWWGEAHMSQMRTRTSDYFTNKIVEWWGWGGEVRSIWAKYGQGPGIILQTKAQSGEARVVWWGPHKPNAEKDPSGAHRSFTPKFVTPTALSCIDNSWRSTTLQLLSIHDGAVGVVNLGVMFLWWRYIDNNPAVTGMFSSWSLLTPVWVIPHQSNDFNS